MKLPALAIALASLVVPAAAQADIAVSDLASDWNYYGSDGGRNAYSFATTLCNLGTVPVAWDPQFDMPVDARNMYRVIDGRIEQLGYSFLTIRVCALNITGCGTCIPTACSTLGIGCATVSALHDGSTGWAKWGIDATRGEWFVAPPGPSGGSAVLNGRLQLDAAKLGLSDVTYVAESHAVSAQDHQAGSGQNNASWRRVNFDNPAAPQGVGPIEMYEPAIFAWRAEHPDVLISEVIVTDEGGPGIDGHIWVASRASAAGAGLWRYDYAVQNLTSELAIGALQVEAPCGAGNVSQLNFAGIEHHSGSPFSDADWNAAVGALSVAWSTETAAQNPNANALRWGTLYSFSFVSDATPDVGGQVTLEQFEQPGTLTANAIVPAGEGFTYPAFCIPTNTSLGVPAQLVASGSPSANTALIELNCSSLPPNQFGYFLMSQVQQLTTTPPGSQGNLCLGSPLLRFAANVLNSGAAGSVQFQPDASPLSGGVQWSAGETWNFQYWTRDGMNPSNFSNLASLTFCR